MAVSLNALSTDTGTQHLEQMKQAVGLPHCIADLIFVACRFVIYFIC